jgi:hypothetical protein
MSMTIRELKRELAQFQDDENLTVNIFPLERCEPCEPVAKGAIAGIGVCHCCHEPVLVVALTQIND